MKVLAKVCGLVRAEDAAQAAAAGADLLGFVCHPPSPRHCAELSVAAPYLDRAVLVMVAEDPETILAQARNHGFRCIQPYLPAAVREQAVNLLRETGLTILLPWADEPDQRPVRADWFLWEPSAKVTGVLGGSGQGHGLSHPPPGPFLLAGGLNGTNVQARLSVLPIALRSQFRGVDAASRLEAAPGQKDHLKVSAFVSAAHALEFP